MNDSLVRGETARPRRLSAAAGAAAAAAAEPGANVSPQDGEMIEVHPRSETGPDRMALACGRMERRNSLTQALYQRHMPMEPLKFHIPRKTKENRALFQYVSTESREYEEMLTVLTSSYIDTSSASCYTYCQPRLIHSDQLEKEFVEKRKEMKADGRTDKELEESYCFLLADTVKLHQLCEKGLFVGQSWITVLGNPRKGVYLSRYSDLLQINALTPGATGEIIIFKVMKGKVKSIYENMKNLLDPTPRFDSHISKNASKVTSLNSYRAFELTQQYFYEYSFDELLQRPRQVCPHSVVSFHFKGKDSVLPSKTLAPIRLNSQSSETNKEHAQYTVWTGELVKGDRVLFPISICSYSPPFLPHRLPEKLEIGSLMRLDQVTKLVPLEIFSYNLYNGSQEAVTNGYCCSLLEVNDRSRSTANVTRLLQELEIKRVVLVTPLTERGFLFLLSSVQMATPTERGDNWKRCLQAIFVFPESRDVAKSTPRCAPSSCDASLSSMSGATMPQLKQFIPALHHALIKTRANPSPELSAGVEHQVREYFIGLNDGKVRQYPMGEYDSKLDEQGKMFPAPRHHRVNMDGYLRSYLYSPTLYLLSVACIKQVMEAHCSIQEPQEVRLRGQIKATGKDGTSNPRRGQSNTQEIQQLIDLVLTCKRNAENEVNREEGGLRTPGRKRRLEQETAQRTLKFLKASQEPGRREKIPVEGSQVSASPGSLEYVINSVGLKDMDLREDGSELAARLLSLLTGLSQAASGTAGQRLSEGQEDGQRESSPFDKLATKLGLPTNCDIDLRRQEELEDQTAGSISSLEGFSPSSHSGETHHHGAARGGGQGRRVGGYEEEDEEEEWQIPWVLIPITGLCSERYTHRDRNIPQDPRFQHLATATTITTTTKPTRKSPTPSPEPSSPPSPSQCPSPEPSPPPSPSQCPSPDPSPPPSPSQCPSPEPSSPPSPSQVISPEQSPPTSPSRYPSPHTSPPTSSCKCLSPPSASQCHSPKPNELNKPNRDLSGANEELALTVSKEFKAMDRKEKPQEKGKKNEEPYFPLSFSLTSSSHLKRKTSTPTPLTEPGKEHAGEISPEVEVVQRGLLEVLKSSDEVAEDAKQDVEEIIGLNEMVDKKEQKDAKVGSLLPLSVSSSNVNSVQDIDSIVNKHLGDFSSEIQLLLQEQSIHYNLPQSPHSTSNPETTEHQKILPHASISQFSQYVSFYNPCPPVQNYVQSLQNSITSMLTELERWPSHNSGSSQNDADTALASSVSAFVAGIRAGNATEGDDKVSASSELMTGDVDASVRQRPVFPDATNRNSQTSRVALPVPTSVPGSSCHSPKLHPPHIKPLQSHWQPQKDAALEISRKIAQNVGQSQDNSTIRTLHCTTGIEAERPNYQETFSDGSKHLTEQSHSSEPVSSSASLSVPGNGTCLVPPATALSSLISQLQPEVFSSLVEIIKDVKRNTLQFYLHSSKSEDPFYEDVTELLLKQGNTELNPVAFLSQDNTDNRLLVIIRNKDISGHIHKIPGLMSLKRHPSVVFVGIDTLDDIRNNSYIELFVSGGCIVSDELVLNPDFITHDRLAELLTFLEKHSSPDSVWKWKVHCKTHKKLKEQARFRRDAADLLEVLSTYQKRQIVEFLPYHHCDMMNHQSPDLDCLIELQGRYTHYRHTVFLTELHFEKFAAYSGSGIIVASIEELLQDFTRLVGYHDVKDKQPITNELLSPKGLSRQLSHSDSVMGQPSSDKSQQPGSGLPSLPHLSDQLVPDASRKGTAAQHSDTDFEALRQAISQLRAERQAQLQQQQLDKQTDCLTNALKNPSSLLGPSESVQLPHGRKAVAATLELIHSAMHPEPGDQKKVESIIATSTERQRKATAEEAKATGAGSTNQPDSTSDRTEEVDQQGEHANSNTSSHNSASSSTATFPVEGNRPRNTLLDKEQPSGADDIRPRSTTASGIKLTGSKASATGQGDDTNPCLQPAQQQIKEQLHPPQRHSHQQPPPQQQWSAGLLQRPHLARHNQPFSSGHMLGPLTTLRGIRGILGPTPVWTGGLPPTAAATLVWGIPQPRTGASLLGGYHNPAGQGNSRYRGGQRGGGFNGM